MRSKLQRVCPHWYTDDPNATYKSGPTATIERGEKCMICGHLRWHIRIEDGFEPHPSQDIELEDHLSTENVTVKRVGGGNTNSNE